MELNYTYIEFINKKRCPNFTGVKEHGNRAILGLDDNSRDQLELYGENPSLNVFEDGAITLYQMHYDSYEEEYIEDDAKTLSVAATEKIKKALDKMLKANPIFCPSLIIIDNYNTFVKFLKTGSF